MSKFFYKGVPIDNFLSKTNANNNVDVTKYTGFPSFAAAPSATSASVIKTDLKYNLNSNNDRITDVYNMVANSTTVTGTNSSITIPSWCNSVKITMNTKKGSVGATGATGTTSAQNAGVGATGAVGATGDTGGYVDEAAAFRKDAGLYIHADGGPGGGGGPGGPGGVGGAGGVGGVGGGGGDGGAGSILEMTDVYVFPSSTISTNFAENYIEATVSVDANNYLYIKSNKGGTGGTGGTGGVGGTGVQGGTGGRGGKGGTGNQGHSIWGGGNDYEWRWVTGSDPANCYRDGGYFKRNNNYQAVDTGIWNPNCGHVYRALPAGTTGAANTTTGTQGSTGATGSTGGTGGTGSTGNTGDSALSVVYNTSPGTDPTYTTTTTTSTTDSVTIYFFPT